MITIQDSGSLGQLTIEGIYSRLRELNDPATSASVLGRAISNYAAAEDAWATYRQSLGEIDDIQIYFLHYSARRLPPP